VEGEEEEGGEEQNQGVAQEEEMAQTSDEQDKVLLFTRLFLQFNFLF
jgi:hypothetical protein